MMWKVAYRNLFRNRRRTLATGVAIVAGFIGLTLLGAYIIRVKNSLKVNTVYLNHHGHLSIYKHEGLQRFNVKPSRYQITGDELRKIKEIVIPYQKQIEFTGEVLSGSGLISNGMKSTPFLATGIQTELEALILEHPEVQKWAKDFLVHGNGSFAAAAEKNPAIISITRRLGEFLAKEPPFDHLSEDERSVQLAGRSYLNDLNAVNAELSVTHTTGMSFAEDTSVWTPLSMLQELYGTDGVHYFALYLRNESNMLDLKSRLETDFKKAGLNLDVYTFDNALVSPNYVGSMSFLNVMSAFFVFLISGAVALSIVNSLTMGILERTKEIGTLRALGFEARRIRLLFSQEALFLTLISIVTGAFLATLISTYLNHLNIRFSPPGIATDVQFLLTPNFSLISVVALLLILISTITGYLASGARLKRRVIDLLSDSGA